MVAVRSMLARVQRLEKSRRPPLIAYLCSPEFEAEIKAGIAAGKFDPTDMASLVPSVQKWGRDRVWELWA